MASPQYVDVSVSKAKFDRELAEYHSMENEYRRRGWFLVRDDYPLVLVAMAAPQLTPPAIVTGVAIDFTNYDVEPPSVRLVNPFTEEPYIAKNLPTNLARSIPGPAQALPGLPPGAQFQLLAAQPLMQSHSPEDVPFLCIAGVKEYHEHPGHSGDAWELHRSEGAGRLVRLLDVVYRYGVQAINGYGVDLVPQIGFQVLQPPR